MYAIADRNNEIIETNEDNNDKRRSINISTINPAGPDLVCNFVKWEINGTNTEVSSQNLCLDEEYRLYWNITNIGNLDVSGGFQVSHRALISTKPYMDGTAITFDSRFVNASSHDVGTIITADDNSEWEGVSEGNFYLLLVADTGVDVDEINEENNVMVIPITLNNCNNTPLPDVAVNINSVTPFASALGDYITVDMTITNIGNETITQNFGLRLALSEDDEFNGTGGTNNFNDHGLVDDGYDNITQDLSPGQSISHSMTAYTQSGTGTQNPITQAGQMYLFAVLDENGDIVAEQNRDNNIDYVPIELTSVDCYYNFEATTKYTGVYTWNQDSYSLIIRAITEDGCNWTVSSPQDWVFFSTTNFTDSDYIDFTLYENPYPFSRSGQILIENEIFYEFTQDAKPCELLSDDIKISLGSSSITNIDCTTKGSIDISVQNGFPPYTYVWSNGESTQDLDNISQLGDYTVTITDSSGCSLLETFTIIDVENIDTTISLQEITLLVLEDDADSYQWIRCDTSNTVIQGANSQSYEVQDEGSYKVEIVKGDCTVESICFDAFWDFDIDYAITSVGLSCINSDDGTITISTQIENTYNISITSSENNFSENRLMDSSNNWHIIQENLSGGEYIIDITINGYPEGIYKKTFILNLDEPEPLEATNRVASDGNGFTVEMTTGTAPFTIKLNNEIIGTTNASEYSFDANHGDIVEVSTVKACEGKYIETLSMLDAIVLHPNPTDDMVYFSIPTMEDNTALDIQISDSNGRLIETFNSSISNRQIEISIQHLSIGVYFAKFPTLGETTFKIIKE